MRIQIGLELPPLPLAVVRTLQPHHLLVRRTQTGKEQVIASIRDAVAFHLKEAALSAAGERISR